MSALKITAGTVKEDSMSPEAQLMGWLATVPPRIQQRLRSHVRSIADLLEGTCTSNVELAAQRLSASYTRCCPERHALIAYAPDVRPTAVLALCATPWPELQVEGEHCVARARSHGMEPRRAIEEAVHLALASPKSRLLDCDLVRKTIATAVASTPAEVCGRLPIAWAVVVGKRASAVIPVILPPTIQEIEAGTWENSR
jgi:hypothetical protein